MRKNNGDIFNHEGIFFKDPDFSIFGFDLKIL
jgi:hypothetical protein